MAAKRSSRSGSRSKGGKGKAYGEAASRAVKRTMTKRKKGTLRSSSGAKVTSKKQAIAIGLSEARSKGAKVPQDSKE